MVCSEKVWACPFFKRDEMFCVRCGNGTMIKFPDIRARILYINSYCANSSKWKECTIAESLNESKGERQFDSTYQNY